MNKFEKILPFIYVLICAVPTAFGFGAISAVMLCAILAAEYVKKPVFYYGGLLFLVAVSMYFANYGNIYYFAGYFALICVTSLCIGVSIKGKKNLVAHSNFRFYVHNCSFSCNNSL